jgi:cell division protein FtsL
MLVLILIVILSTIHLAIYTRSINLKYQVEDLKRELIGLKNDLRGLEAAATGKKNLSRIESIAVNKLRMIRPEKIEYVTAASGEFSP